MQYALHCNECRAHENCTLLKASITHIIYTGASVQKCTVYSTIHMFQQINNNEVCWDICQYNSPCLCLCFISFIFILHLKYFQFLPRLGLMFNDLFKFWRECLCLPSPWPSATMATPPPTTGPALRRMRSHQRSSSSTSREAESASPTRKASRYSSL